VVAALATVIAVFLHVVFLTHAGALWRDEASTVYLATLPSLRDVWRWLPYDHCPPMIHIAIRAWWTLGLAGSDFSLRVLGLCLGLLLPAAFWAASRIMRSGPPLLPLALVAVNPTIISVGDSFRGYGLGAVLNVLMLALVWRLARNLTRVNAMLAALAAVLSVQCLYQNAFFVLTACCGGIVVCLMRRRYRGTLWILGVGLLAALSLVPYIQIVRRSQEWYALEKSGFTFAVAWNSVSSAIGFPIHAFSVVWVALSALALGAGLFAVRQWPQTAREADQRELALFAATSVLVGTATFVLFLKTADLPTQPWSYTPLMAFVALCLGVGVPASHRWARPAVLVFAALATIAACPLALPALQTRQTNVDVIAQHLAQDAAAGDYVIVHPWYCGATFARYYKGAASWSTLPPLADHYLHRYDLLKVEMQKENAIQPVLDKVASTLQSGHRVWLVGPIPLTGERPLAMRPAPGNEWGWWDEPYSLIWAGQAGYFIVSHAERGGLVMAPEASGVSSYENLPVVMVTGWRLAGS
jgi:hypothetical protein